VTSFLRLLLVTALALAVGILVGAAVTFGSDHRRQMAPPLPANLALYEPPTTSTGASTPVAVPDRALVRPDPAAPAGDGQGRQLSGLATWYATGSDCLCAAAGPALRVGAWRGSTVTVNGLAVRLIDACWCVDRHGLPTLLDLSDEVFARFAPLSRGVIEVEVQL